MDNKETLIILIDKSVRIIDNTDNTIIKSIVDFIKMMKNSFFFMLITYESIHHSIDIYKDFSGLSNRIVDSEFSFFQFEQVLQKVRDEIINTYSDIKTKPIIINFILKQKIQSNTDKCLVNINKLLQIINCFLINVIIEDSVIINQNILNQNELILQNDTTFNRIFENLASKLPISQRDKSVIPKPCCYPLTKNTIQEFIRKGLPIITKKIFSHINININKITNNYMEENFLNKNYNIYKQTTEKPNNDYFENNNKWRKNEDRVVVKEISHNKLLFGLADGAGSSGLYCGEWAQCLLDNLPKNPITNCDDFNDWIESFWESFYNKYISASNDKFLKNKLLDEGSCSTLLSGWMDIFNDYYILYLISYGDSVFFNFQLNDNIAILRNIYPNSSLEFFEKAPHLINWNKKAINSYFFYHKLKLERSDVIIATTDGFAQYLFTQYLIDIHMKNVKNIKLSTKDYELLQINQSYINDPNNIKVKKSIKNLLDECGDKFSFKNLLSTIKNKLTSSNTFKDYTYDLYNKGLLSNDDCSVIYIDFNKT